jgi:phenylalanyl-tRNA synthetase beta chain
VGTTVYPISGEPFKISKAKIRGEVSEGMICAEDEIGLGKSHEGIMVLKTDLLIGTPASEYFKIESDDIFEIGLTPNRADAASHLGVARDLKALYKNAIKPIVVQNFKSDDTSKPVKVTVEDNKACIRYSGLTITGLTVKESPEWLKNRLKSIGLSPINNVVDVTNFILHDLGQPLHAFDLSKVTGNTVIVKTVKEGTEFTTLDKISRKLKSTDLMICNAEEPMCIAGVFGGIKSGVTEQTTSIFLESACFSADSIRRTGINHGLKTDASFRFERGTDPNITVTALQKAALLIKEVAGGKISSDIVDIYPSPVKNFIIETSYKNLDRLIGLKIDRAVIKEILTSLEIQITSESSEGLTLSVPPYRVDVQREADIVEEIIRIYGYDKIEVSEILQTDYLADFPERDKDKLQNRIGQSLSAIGFNEIITNSLTKPAYSESLNKSTTDVVILNKLSEDLAVMRQSLLFSGLEVVAHNINRKQKDVKLFEFGKTYSKGEGKYNEKNYLALFITGNANEESWIEPAKASSFYLLKTAVAQILDKTGISGLTYDKADDKIFEQRVSLVRDKKLVVSFGQVHSKFNKMLDIKQPVFYAEFDFDFLLKNYKTGITYEEISKFPEVRRDLSLVLNKSVNFEEIRKIALQTERKLLREINVFDVYEGKNLGEGKKSYSVSFILQDFEQTLTDKVIDKTMEKLMQTFEKELGAVIRK